MNKNVLSRFVFVLALLSLSACQGRRFEPSWLVNKLRVLAVQSDLPELRPGQSTTLRALVESDKPVTYEWEWCPLDTSPENLFECALTQEEIDELLASSVPDGFDPSLIPFEELNRGTEAEVPLAYPAPQPLLLALCEGIRDAFEGEDVPEELAQAIPALYCEDGLRVSIRMKVSTDDDEIIAAKRLNIWLASEQDQDVNPIVNQIQIRPHDADDRGDLVEAGHTWVQETGTNEWYTIPEDEPAKVLVNVRYDLRSVIDEDSVQTYRRRAPQGSEDEFLEPRSEVIGFNWFTTGGAILGDDDSIFVEGSNTLDDAGTIEWLMPVDDLSQAPEQANGAAFIESCPELETADPDDGCQIDFWSVVRDDRLGVDYLSRSILATGVRE